MATDVQWRKDVEVEQFIDCPHLFFPFEMFKDDPTGFEIDYSTAVSADVCCVVRDGSPCHEKCMEGVLVKWAEPLRIWRLTGEAATERVGKINHLRGYEGKWPD